MTEEGPFGGHGLRRGEVVQSRNVLCDLIVAVPDLNRESTLSDGRHHDVGRQNFTYAIVPAEPYDTCPGEYHSRPGRCFKFFHPCYQVAANLDDLHVGTDIEELAGPAKTSGGNLSTPELFQQPPPGIPRVGDEHIACILAFTNCPEKESGGKFRWKIFEAVDGDVNIAIEERLLDLAGEESLVADLGQRRFENSSPFVLIT